MNCSAVSESTWEVITVSLRTAAADSLIARLFVSNR
jgi:hypothetical protein